MSSSDASVFDFQAFHSNGSDCRVPVHGSGRPEVIRVLLADFHALFRSGLRALLSAEPGFDVIGEAADEASAVRMTRDGNPDLLLLDWEMARRNGMAILKELALTGTSTGILLITVPSNATDVARAIQLGAKGVLSSETTAESLCDGMQRVMDGHYVLGRVGVASLVGVATDPKPKSAFQNARRKFGITRREFEIVSEVVEGYSTAEMSDRLSLSSNTLKHHISHIFDKLGVSNRLELVLFAVNHHIVPDRVKEAGRESPQEHDARELDVA